jgi:hypothetical protein
MIKTAKKQSHGTSDFEVFRKEPQILPHREEKSKKNKEENLWYLFCVLVTLSPIIINTLRIQGMLFWWDSINMLKTVAQTMMPGSCDPQIQHTRQN